MKRFITILMVLTMMFALTGCREKEQYTTAAPAKPVIYL